MKILNNLLPINEYEYPNLVLALGTFDGVHLGHSRVIKEAVKKAKEINGTSGVFTFSTHPLDIINPDISPKIIYDEKTKYRKIEELGVDILISIPFSKEFAKCSKEEFMDILKNYFHAKWIITGPNFTFGYKGEGNVETLKNAEKNYGFKSIMQHFIYSNNDMVNSTTIRDAIIKGDMDKVNRMLNAPFSITEEVIHGKKRGRMLGFPTANLAIDNKRAMLPNGVYIVEAYLDNKRYPAVASIGTNPTFNDIKRRVEVYILDFDAMIYGKMLRVDFLVKLRNEMKFNSITDLINQMKQDISKAREFFR